MVKICKKCGKQKIKIIHHHHRDKKQWIAKLITEFCNSKGDVEFIIKSKHYHYQIWYCPKCDSITKNMTE
jgi:hypothetical protein